MHYRDSDDRPWSQDSEERPISLKWSFRIVEPQVGVSHLPAWGDFLEVEFIGRPVDDNQPSKYPGITITSTDVSEYMTCETWFTKLKIDPNKVEGNLVIKIKDLGNEDEHPLGAYVKLGDQIIVETTVQLVKFKALQDQGELTGGCCIESPCLLQLDKMMMTVFEPLPVSIAEEESLYDIDDQF